MAAELALTLTASEADRLEQAEGVVRSYCGWHIAPSRTETVTVRSRGSAVVPLPSLHVTAVASVTRDDAALVLDDEYVWSEAGVLTVAYRWATLVVEFTHGYEDVPPEVTGVVQAVAQRASDNPGSMLQEAAGPFNERRAGTGAALELLPTEKTILDRYRLPVLA